MKKIWDACNEAGVTIPSKVLEFFNHEEPDDAGVSIALEGTPAVKEYTADMREGFEVEISKLPASVKFIRFWNSY